MSDDERWAVPGVPLLPRPAAPAPDTTALSAALGAVLALDPSLLAPEVAVARAEVLLGAQDRLVAAGMRAVADVETRELWSLRAAGSTCPWLRTLPCGDAGQLALARWLQERPVLSEALAAGEVSLRTGGVVARQLARVPARVDVEHVQAVLVDGLGTLLGVWAGAACLEPTASQGAEFEARREQLADLVQAGLQDCWSEPAGRREPAFVLAARVLAPPEVATGLQVLVDALQPAPDLDAEAERELRSRELLLRKLKGGGGSLRAHLTDETGQLLHAELVPAPRRPRPGREVEGTPLPSMGQRPTTRWPGCSLTSPASAPAAVSPHRRT